MKGLKNFYVCLFSALVGCTCILSLPSLSARYKKTFTEQNAFEIEFPIINVGEVVANTLSDQFAEILNKPESYETLINQMNTPPKGTVNIFGYKYEYDLRDETYMGNVEGADSKDTQTIRSLFGLADGKELVLNNKPVTVMIKRENLDGDTETGEPSGDGNIQGAELTIYTTAEDVSGKSVEVYAMVFSKYNGEINNGKNTKFCMCFCIFSIIKLNICTKTEYLYQNIRFL